jgi:glutamine synthetase
MGGRRSGRFVRDERSGVVAHASAATADEALDRSQGPRTHLTSDGGERADGSSLFGDLGIPVGASDIVMRPRLSTAFVDPFAAEPTLAVLCSHFNRQGEPLAESPDTLVRAAYKRLVEETGVELHALGEIEFFLGARLGDAEAYGANERGYHSTAPFVFGETLRRTALVHLAQMGVAVIRPRGSRIRRGRRRLARVGTARISSAAPLPGINAVVLTQ